ncbi:dynein axonemal intermediate chain 7 homolog isoform X1 [Drosophila santomea]|uniref:dynein axonemal intermediate chain 7 homolog isoform X1 n=1 Tax=Drosophila santomea TaxID=129105 RepID=UPI001954CFAB|nr:dynein axonemal intermediate chain 7 homolog isoform X1 [Drosophila santomea]
MLSLPPKKKLSKKEKARLEAEQAELMRIEMEKEKLKKLEEARQRKKLEMEQAKHRQQQEVAENRQRRAQLKDSMLFFDAVRTAIEAIKDGERHERDWEKFMRCNGLPNAASPSDLRKYIHQWHTDIAKRHLESRNWLLRTDERTLLTQDAQVPDLTRISLRQQQGRLGDVYAQRIKEVLGILNELDEMLPFKQKSALIAADLVKLKTDMRVFLKQHLDEFTYKTMSHIERDMETDRPGVSKHIYSSDVFQSFVWTFSKDAQIALNPKARIGEQSAHNEIDFPTIEMQISLPPTVYLQSSALRGLWLNYDHFSDYCGSYCLKHARSANANILRQTKREWRKRKEILQAMLDECGREIPLSELEQLTQDQHSASSQPPRERTYDVDKLYAEYEDELSKAHRRAIGPEAYGMLETDVNLRKYRIIGGVYCIDFLETPQQDKQLNARSFIRTITSANSLVHKEYYQTYKPPPPVLPGVRRLPEEIEAEMRMIEAALDKLALVTLQLPDSVIWFEPPVACRWETNVETLEMELADGMKPEDRKPHADGEADGTGAVSGTAAATTATPTEATPLSTHAQPSPLKSSPRCPARMRSQKSDMGGHGECRQQVLREINDFDLRAIPSDVDLYGLVKDFVVPRLPQGFCVRLEQSTPILSTGLRQRKVMFLARQAHIRLGQAKEVTDDQLEIPKELQKLQLNCKPGLGAEFLDTEEPAEMFPPLCFDKLLKFRQMAPRSRAPVHLQGYLFSQLIEDMDRLWRLQLPRDQQEELIQQISEQLSPTGSRTSDPGEKEPREVENDGDLAENMQPLSQELVDVLQPAAAAAAFAYYTGISFVRDSQLPAEPDPEASAKRSNSMDSSEDDDDDVDSLVELLEGASTAANTLHDLLGPVTNSDNSDSESKQKMSNVAAITQGKWSTRDVHDTKFNEDKLSIQFRTGRLGIFGFALNKYSNMPYQTWDLRPDMKNPGTIIFSFTASLISLDMTITKSGYTVNNFQGGSTQGITDMIGKTLSLAELKATLILSAVDIFPDEDAFCYTEGSCEKNYVMEMHCYACLSTLAQSHNFSWSRWNLLAGSRTAVLLVRELIEGKKVPYYSTLLVTPLKTSIIDCTEVSASFNAVGIPGMEYYADLYQLSQAHAQPGSLEKQKTMNPVLRDNVAKILMAIRPLSLC